MKYCLQCSSEYRDDAERCSDCGAPLVGQEQWERACRVRAQEASEEFIPLKTADDLFAAEVFRDALENEGIPVIVRSFADISFDGIFIPQKGWGLILVPREFRDRAQGILAALEQSAPPPPEQ